MFKKNDYVLITDSTHPYFLKVGKVNIILDETIVVIFRSISKYGGNELDEVSFYEEDLKIMSKTLAFK